MNNPIEKLTDTPKCPICGAEMKPFFASQTFGRSVLVCPHGPEDSPYHNKCRELARVQKALRGAITLNGRLRHQRLRQRETWVEVAKEQPPEGELVWFFQDGRIWPGIYEFCHDDPGGWFYGHADNYHYLKDSDTWDAMDNEWDDDYRPTHWHPFPEAPHV